MSTPGLAALRSGVGQESVSLCFDSLQEGGALPALWVRAVTEKQDESVEKELGEVLAIRAAYSPVRGRHWRMSD